MKKVFIICFVVIFAFIFAGCAQTKQGGTPTPTPTVSSSATPTASPTTSGIPTATPSYPALVIVSWHPDLNSMGVSSTEYISITFNNEIDPKVRADSSVINYASFYLLMASDNTAGLPRDYDDLILSWSADGKTYTISNLSGWSSLEADGMTKRVHIFAKSNVIKDIHGKYLPETVLASFELKAIL